MTKVDTNSLHVLVALIKSKKHSAERVRSWLKGLLSLEYKRNDSTTKALIADLVSLGPLSRSEDEAIEAFRQDLESNKQIRKAIVETYDMAADGNVY